MAVIPYAAQTWVDGTSSASAARLGVIEAGVLSAHLMPAVRVWHNTTQGVANASFAVLGANAEDFDTAAGANDTQHDIATNNSRLTCRYAGIYQITANGQFAVAAGGTLRQLRLMLNNTTEVARGPNIAPHATNAISVTVSSLSKLAVNDYVETQGYQDSGAAILFTFQSFSWVRVA